MARRVTGRIFSAMRADFVGRRIFGAQLDQVAAAVAKLLRDEFGRAAMQIGRVHEGVKFAVRERFHGMNLTGDNGENRVENILYYFAFNLTLTIQSKPVRDWIWAGEDSSWQRRRSKAFSTAFIES